MKPIERISPIWIFSMLALAAAFFLGVGFSAFNPIYSGIVAAVLAMVLIILLRLDELIVALVIAAHILIDTYLGFAVYQIALLMALLLLVTCYFGRSESRPWTGPRLLWLWLLFLILAIVPTFKGGFFSLSNAFGYYLEIVVSPFVMFWLGNIIAKDVSAIRRVFQFLALLAIFFAIHVIIQATTGVFLFETARAKANLLAASNFQITSALSRASSFFGNPNGAGIFLATSFFIPLGLFMESKQFWSRMLYLLEMLLILLGLLFTYSNGSWIAALVGLVAFIFLVGRLRYSVLLLLMAGTLAIIAFTLFPTHVAAQLAHARDQGDLSLHLGDWQTAIRVIAAYPLFGVGLGNQAYLVLSSPYRVLAQTKPLAEPDNAYLQWGAVAGIPVMLIFLALLVSVFWFAWRNWQAVEIRYRPLIAGGIAALLALSINSLSVDGWTSPIYTQFLGWLVAGIVTSPLIGRSLRRQPSSAYEKAKKAHMQVGISQLDTLGQGL